MKYIRVKYCSIRKEDRSLAIVRNANPLAMYSKTDVGGGITYCTATSLLVNVLLMGLLPKNTFQAFKELI